LFKRARKFLVQLTGPAQKDVNEWPGSKAISRALVPIERLTSEMC
jgi:hypothetical protein